MLILLSPAKTLDFENARVLPLHTYPEFAEKAKPLIKQLRKYSPKELMDLMNISQNLAQLNHSRFRTGHRFRMKPTCGRLFVLFTAMYIPD